MPIPKLTCAIAGAAVAIATPPIIAAPIPNFVIFLIGFPSLLALVAAHCLCTDNAHHGFTRHGRLVHPSFIIPAFESAWNRLPGQARKIANYLSRRTTVLSGLRTALILSAAAPGCCGIAGCATLQQRVAEQENLIAAAGFTVLPANTPERQSELAMLPPHRFIMRTNASGEVEYVYADPLNCNCLYIGTQANYGAFSKEIFQLRLANEAQSTAMLYNDASVWNRFNWGPWGPGWW